MINKEIYDKIASLADESIEDTFYAISEEVGELALSLHVRNKTKSRKLDEPPENEAVDVILCAIEMLVKLGIDPEEINKIAETKLQKWKRSVMARRAIQPSIDINGYKVYVGNIEIKIDRKQEGWVGLWEMKKAMAQTQAGRLAQGLCMKESDRSYWYIGNRNVFRLSKDRCQRLMHALLVCNGKIHDSHTTSLDRQKNKIYDGIRIGDVDVMLCISIKIGSEDTFRAILGNPNCLEVPPKDSSKLKGVIMFVELMIYTVFSVDIQHQQMVLTRGPGQNYVVSVDKNTKYDKEIFQHSFNKILNGETVKVKVDGIINDQGKLKANFISEEN